MTIYLLLCAYVLAGIVSSLCFAEALDRVTRRWDAEDFAVVAVCSLLWPLTWAARGWWAAFVAYRRWRTDATLRRYGADTEEDPDRG